jgi:predicted amidohydrolase
MGMAAHFTRRKFIGDISLGMGAAGIAAQQNIIRDESLEYSPRQVNLGTVSVMDLSAGSPGEMIQKVLQIMEQMIPYRPDIICLPEIFAFTGIPHDIKVVAEIVPSQIVQPFMNFAAKHRCYVICPTYSREGDSIYIAAVLINRSGKVVGEYRKMRPAQSELEMGIRPGPIDPPVFETDFGKIGIQICFDLKYEEGWNALKKKGAQFIFWPSAYAGGSEISSRAWRHQVFLVTSTQKDTSKICDLSGETIAQTNRWQRHWVCAPVNPEKAFVLTWPAVQDFPAMLKKYGSRIRINTFSEEEWTFIESLDSNLKIADVLKAYQLKPMYDFLNELSLAHEAKR